MRFLRYLKEEEIDSEDWGAAGKKFESIFIKACKLIGLDLEENRYAGRLWDIHAKGNKWKKILSNKDINIKVYGTKWMFGSSELYKILPWDGFNGKEFDESKAISKVKRILNKLGFNKTVFLKPKNKDIQNKIIQLVKEKNIEELDKIMVSKNFLVNKINNYDVRILKNSEKITSIVVDYQGKVFMRSEKPRVMGAGKGSMMVTFRTPTSKISKIEKEVKK